MSEKVCEVTITAPDRDWLAALCRDLIEARLASSAHVVYPVASVYRWQGLVREAQEARAFLRTRESMVDPITEIVMERHPYDVPNVTAVPIIGGNPEYLQWIRQETRPRADGTR